MAENEQRWRFRPGNGVDNGKANGKANPRDGRCFPHETAMNNGVKPSSDRGTPKRATTSRGDESNLAADRGRP
eukprot:scaffold320_cov335-Pavlova_lutheri.AAC.29